MIRRDLSRAWQRHWTLQMASVVVMTMVLMSFNFLLLGHSIFQRTLAQWGQGLEMIVYVRDGVSQQDLEDFSSLVKRSGDFSGITYLTKDEATKKFLEGLGSESLKLLADPKWKSPIPASFELTLGSHIALDRRVDALRSWTASFRSLKYVDEIFYGQGWIENFSRFVSGAQGLLLLFWVFCVAAGLLIVGNCIQLSFTQRREEIEVLELVGATQRFIRIPFLFEGLALGVVAAALASTLSFVLHSFLLDWLSPHQQLWMSVADVPALRIWHVGLNLLAGVAFGGAGAWFCVRKLNHGWLAATRK